MVALAPYLSTNGTEQSLDRTGILQLQKDMHLASKENLATGWWAALGCDLSHHSANESTREACEA